jgi:hypothetical protein
LSRAQRGSRNHAKAARRLRREHARVADARRSFLREVSSQLVKNHALLAVKDLAVHNLVRHNRLARAVGDAAWSEFARQLTYKADWFGVDLAAWAEHARALDRQAGGQVTNASGGEGAGRRLGDGETGPSEGGTNTPAITGVEDTREGWRPSTTTTWVA